MTTTKAAMLYQCFLEKIVMLRGSLCTEMPVQFLLVNEGFLN